MSAVDSDRVLRALRLSWSCDSSSLWTEENPARGQCGVTALVVHDLLGGAIMKTRVRDSWHFYNSINGERVDLTAEQFDEAVVYSDEQSSRDEAFADTDERQYLHLGEAVRRALSMETTRE